MKISDMDFTSYVIFSQHSTIRELKNMLVFMSQNSLSSASAQILKLEIVQFLDLESS